MAGLSRRQGNPMFYGLDPQQLSRLYSAIETIAGLYGRAFHADQLIALNRCMGFYDNKRFSSAFERNAETEQEKSLAWRLHTLTWAAEHCIHVPGDFVECGVYKGFCSAVIIDYLNFETLEKSFFLYDTFQGIPPDRLEGSPHLPEDYQIPGLYDQVVARFYSTHNVTVIQGIVPESFQQDSPESIAYLHLDMNSARSELDALESLFERVSAGGMIILDDYGWQPYRAQKEAEDPFFQNRGYSVLELPTGQGLVIKR